MNSLILNCLPPSESRWPSPSMSILKGYVENFGYPAHIHYWNISLRPYMQDFYKLNDTAGLNQDYAYVAPFINYINMHRKNNLVVDKFIAEYMSTNPHVINSEKSFFQDHFQKSADILYEEIKKRLSQLHIENCLLFGVASKLFQMIPANVISEIVKEISPLTKVVIGGIGTKEEAVAIMENFDYYDFAIWGEGEYPLLQLYKYVLGEETDPASIPHLVYRDNDSIHVSNAKHRFLDLNGDIKPDYSDFFEQNTKEIKELNLPVEGSRGCHWSKCRFCFLNDGYRYRVKDNEHKIREMENLIDCYGVKKFIFLDNDTIGKDIASFHQFLDELIRLREKHNDMEIVLAEIISKGLSSEEVKKMALAGFSSVQVGYESPSNEILKKIDKKNSFASNLLFIKWAYHYNIIVGGANVLRGLLEETDEDVIESIDNLKFMRFFLVQNYFEHNLSFLAVGKSSRYYTELEKQGKLDEWNENIFLHILPEDYIRPKDKFTLFYFTKKDLNRLWQFFERVQSHYLLNNFEYNLIELNGKIIFQEIFNKKKINEIEFNEPLHWEILKRANHKVKSLDEMYEELKMIYPETERSKVEESVRELKDEYLLYTNKDMTEMVTVFNTDYVLK